jgi:hypothetical protein
MTIKFARVDKRDIQNNVKCNYGKYVRFFDKLLDLQRGETAAVTVASKKDGYNMTAELRRIAKKEELELGWSRSRDNSTFYYWLERPVVEMRGAVPRKEVA